MSGLYGCMKNMCSIRALHPLKVQTFTYYLLVVFRLDPSHSIQSRTGGSELESSSLFPEEHNKINNRVCVLKVLNQIMQTRVVCDYGQGRSPNHPLGCFG